MNSIFHITSSDQAQAATESGTYIAPSFQAEGFIHCSYRHQVEAVANRLFRGRKDLVVLEIDPSKLDVAVIDENLEGGLELFPHVYGPVPMTAVVAIHPRET